LFGPSESVSMYLSRAVVCSAFLGSALSHSALPDGYPADCRNLTWNLHGDGGPLRVMSWHVHYNTNTSEFARFYDLFVSHYSSMLSPFGVKCPFGFDAGEPDYLYFCSLDDPPSVNRKAMDITLLAAQSYGPFSTPSRAFWVPERFGEEVFRWASAPAVRVTLDVLLHPNTGCMYDDHGPRASWVTLDERPAPIIQRLDFPCNIPGYGCSELDHPCNCTHTPLPSDAPQFSCTGCHASELPALMALWV